MSTQRIDVGAPHADRPGAARRKVIISNTQTRQSPPEHGWVIEGWIPVREAAALGGEKGVGKTTFVTQLAISVAAGLPFMKLKTSRSFPVLFISGEESRGALHHRFNKVIKRVGLAKKSKTLPIRFLDGTSKDSTLCNFTQEGMVERTPFYKELSNDLSKRPGTFVILDSVEKLWTGHNDSGEQVLKFIHECLEDLIMKHQCSILCIYEA